MRNVFYKKMIPTLRSKNEYESTSSFESWAGGISNDGDDRMGAKMKTQKIPQGFQQKPKKSMDRKLTPKNSHAEFLTLIILNAESITN